MDVEGRVKENYLVKEDTVNYEQNYVVRVGLHNNWPYIGVCIYCFVDGLVLDFLVYGLDVISYRDSHNSDITDIRVFGRIQSYLV